MAARASPASNERLIEGGARRPRFFLSTSTTGDVAAPRSVRPLASREGFMTTCRLRGSHWVAAAAAAVLLATPSLAQQAPPTPPPAPAASPAAPMPPLQPQPTTLPGRPDVPNAAVNAKLRGIEPPPLPAAE